MADNPQAGDPEGLESPSRNDLHYRSLVIVIPPVLDEKGNVLSLLQEVGHYGYFIHMVLEAVSVYQPIAFMEDSVKILDVADLQLSFTEEEDLVIYYKILERILRKMDKPLICMATIGDSVDEAIADVVLAEETEKNVSVDVALFEVPKAQYIWDEVTDGLSYIVGPDAVRYQLRNILEHAHKGPLLSAEEILQPELELQEKKRTE